MSDINNEAWQEVESKSKKKNEDDDVVYDLFQDIIDAIDSQYLPVGQYIRYSTFLAYILKHYKPRKMDV